MAGIVGAQNLKRKLDTAGLEAKGDEDRRDRCFKCGGRGHQLKECTSADPTKPGGDLSCYKCQGKGHFARSCPNLTRDVCYFCGTMGHHGLDCPLLTRMVGQMPPAKKKELMSRIQTNPALAQQMREMSLSYAADPYAGMMGGNPNIQSLMSLLGGGAQPSLYSNPYGAAQLGQYPGYGEAAQPAPSYPSYGVPGSPSGGASSAYGAAAAQLYGAQPFAGAGTDVLSALRALSGGYPTTPMGYGAPAPGGGSGCYKCGQQGHFARECPNAPPEGCYRCGQPGHMARDCTNAPGAGAGGPGAGGPTSVAGAESCFRCGERGHFSRDCVKNGAVASKDACFRCGQPGHRTRDCTGPDIRVCFVCKQSGHVSSACPERALR